jgi:hypothetical protein
MATNEPLWNQWVVIVEAVNPEGIVETSSVIGPWKHLAQAEIAHAEMDIALGTAAQDRMSDKAINSGWSWDVHISPLDERSMAEIAEAFVTWFNGQDDGTDLPPDWTDIG